MKPSRRMIFFIVAFLAVSSWARSYIARYENVPGPISIEKELEKRNNRS